MLLWEIKDMMERKKLVLLIAGAVAIALFVLVLFLSSLGRGTEVAEPTPTATDGVITPDGTEPAPTFIDEANRDGMLVNEEGDPEGPPSEAYLNDYSQDDGYERLPENYNGSAAPEGTVYDPQWMVMKYYDLECELSTKRTVTERALQPMVNFSADLMLVTGQNDAATNLYSSMQETLSRYQAFMNQRAPEAERQLMSESCNIEENQPGHIHEDGEEDDAHQNIPDLPAYNPADWPQPGETSAPEETVAP